MFSDSVVVGDSIKTIERYAFSGCLQLKYVRLSKKLEKVGGWAFFCCSSLEALFLPSAVKIIRAGAFYGCLSIRQLVLPDRIDVFFKYVKGLFVLHQLLTELEIKIR